MGSRVFQCNGQKDDFQSEKYFKENDFLIAPNYPPEKSLTPPSRNATSPGLGTGLVKIDIFSKMAN